MHDYKPHPPLKRVEVIENFHIALVKHTKQTRNFRPIQTQQVAMAAVIKKSEAQSTTFHVASHELHKVEQWNNINFVFVIHTRGLRVNSLGDV